MKQIIFILAAVMTLFQAQAQEKTKSMNKSYPASSFKEITVSNRLGNIEIRQGGDVFEVEAAITVRAKTQAKAEEILGYINIEEKVSGDILNYKTVIEKDLSVSKMFAGVEVDVYYLVKVPKGKQVWVVNKEGNVAAGRYSGDLNVEIESGSFTANALTDGILKIRQEKGDFRVPELDRLEADFRSVNIKINEVAEIKMECNGCEAQLAEVDKLTVKSSGGSCYVGDVENLTVTSSYTKYSIQQVGGTIEADCRWGEFNVYNIHYSFEQVNLKSAYAKIGLTFMEDAGYNLDLTYNKATKLELPVEMELEKRPTTNSNTIRKQGHVGHEKRNSKVVVNLSGGKMFIQ